MAFPFMIFYIPQIFSKETSIFSSVYEPRILSKRETGQ